jgi:hypothetical protein
VLVSVKGGSDLHRVQKPASRTSVVHTVKFRVSFSRFEEGNIQYIELK